jgi:HAD superfamily hydrolase (TIGR01509 family)
MTMNKPQAVIFDMDGVLVDSEPFHVQNEKLMFKKLGLDITDEEHSNFTGVATDVMWQQISEIRELPYSVAELTELTVIESNKYFGSLEKIEPFPGLVDLLEQLFDAEIPLAVATSSDAVTMQNILEKSGLRKYFRFAVCRDDVAKSKPAPDVFLRAAELLGILPENCTVIEDSRNGIKAAKAAGMVCIAYSGGNSGHQDQTQADRRISDFNELDFDNLLK